MLGVAEEVVPASAVVVEVVESQLVLCCSQHHAFWLLDHLWGEPSMQSNGSVSVVVGVVSAVDVLIELVDVTFTTAVDL